MSKQLSFAEQEFKTMRENNPDAIILNFEGPILSLINKFNDEELSGGAAPYYRNIIVNVIDKLLDWKPINPIYDKPEFWNEDTYGGNSMQHKINSSVFKDINTGEVIVIEGIIWSCDNEIDDEGKTYSSAFTGWVEGISSALKILEFPYTTEKPLYWPVSYDKTTDKYTIINKDDLIEKMKNRLIVDETK